MLRDEVVLVASEHAFTREAARDLARYLGARRVDSVWTTSEIAGAIKDEMMAPDLVLIDARMDKLTPQSWADAGDAEVVLLMPAGVPVPEALVNAGDVRIAPIPVREKTFLAAIGYGDAGALAASPRRTDARILVAEDVEVNRTVIQALAERLGCVVDLASDGLEAVELVREHAYDLVLMDCNMPEMDGYAATRRIRQLGYDERRLPIIALTANIMPGERERCEAAGMNDYLAKPLGQDQLERCFGRWLPPAGAEADAAHDETPAAAVVPPAAAEPEPTAPAPAVMAIFDHGATLRRLGGNERLLFDVVRSFQSEAREILREIRETLDRRDAEQLRSGAHKLKGALASIGGEAARDVAARLESLAGSGDLEPARSFVERLVAEMARLETELDRYVAARSA
jgi:two-component system sensor histidine kinase/response regulator